MGRLCLREAWYEVAGNYVPGFLVDRNEAEPWFVFFSDQVAAFHPRIRTRGDIGYYAQTRLRHDQPFTFVFNLDVINIGIDRESNVRDERPWRRRPH